MERESTKQNTFWAGGFLCNLQTKQILLHKRDAKAEVNPNKWGFFGGSSEKGETPEQCCIREWHEELGILVKEKDLIPVCSYLNVTHNTWRFVFYIESRLEKSEMVLGEGEDFDWIPFDKVLEYDCTDSTKRDLKTFLQSDLAF